MSSVLSLRFVYVCVGMYVCDEAYACAFERNRSFSGLQIVNDCVISVSSVTGENIPHLVQAIAEVAMSIPHVNDAVPSAYTAIDREMHLWASELVAGQKLPVRRVDEVRAHLSEVDNRKITRAISGEMMGDHVREHEHTSPDANKNQPAACAWRSVYMFRIAHTACTHLCEMQLRPH